MNLSEALEAVEVAGARLEADALGPVLRGDVRRVPPGVVEWLRANRVRVAALLRLREVHRAMGLDEADALMVERAMLAGTVNTVVIAPNTNARPA